MVGSLVNNEFKIRCQEAVFTRLKPLITIRYHLVPAWGKENRVRVASLRADILTSALSMK